MGFVHSQMVTTVKRGVTFCTKLNLIGPCSSLSNEILYTFIAQGAAKLPEVFGHNFDLVLDLKL